MGRKKTANKENHKRNCPFFIIRPNTLRHGNTTTLMKPSQKDRQLQLPQLYCSVTTLVNEAMMAYIMKPMIDITIAKMMKTVTTLMLERRW